MPSGRRQPIPSVRQALEYPGAQVANPFKHLHSRSPNACNSDTRGSDTRLESIDNAAFQTENGAPYNIRMAQHIGYEACQALRLQQVYRTPRQLHHYLAWQTWSG